MIMSKNILIKIKIIKKLKELKFYIEEIEKRDIDNISKISNIIPRFKYEEINGHNYYSVNSNYITYKFKSRDDFIQISMGNMVIYNSKSKFNWDCNLSDEIFEIVNHDIKIIDKCINDILFCNNAIKLAKSLSEK